MLTGNFDSLMEQSLLKDCGIEIYRVYYSSGTWYQEKILDNTNISNFSLVRHNDGVCENVPSDSCTFTILKWSSLSLTIQNHFLNKDNAYPYSSTKGNYIAIRFIVGGVSTSTGILLLVEDCQNDILRNSATIKCASLFADELLGGGWYLLNLLNVALPSAIETTPPNITFAELQQQVAIGLGKGLRKTTYDFSNITIPQNEYVNLSSTNYNLRLASLNITDWLKTTDKVDKSSITYYGMTHGTNTTTLGTSSRTPAISTTGWEQTIGYALSNALKQCYITDFTVYANGEGDVTQQFYIKNRTANGAILATDEAVSSLRTYTFTLIGYNDVHFEEPSTNTNAYYVKCQTLLSTSSQLAVAQANTREYYSHKTYYEIDCRIDPRIEPLDKLLVDGVGVIGVEDVTINFNGGFTGKIKGRLIWDSMLAPEVSNITYDSSSNTFSFTVTNNNPISVALMIYYSGGYYAFTVLANSNKTVTQSNASGLLDSFYAYYVTGELTDEVYCYFYQVDYGRSSYITILEEIQ